MNIFVNPSSIRSIALLVLVVFVNFSCKKDSSNPGTSPVNGTYTLKGKVLSENGSALEGAWVQSGTIIATSGSDGSFTLENVKAENSIISVQIAKTGFFENYCNVAVDEGAEYYTEATMLQKQFLGEINASNGGTLSSPSQDFNIVAPPNSFANEDGTAFSGDVRVAFRYVKWTDFGLLSSALPGGDLYAENESGTSGTLEPFGLFATEYTTTTGAKVFPSNQVKIQFIVPQNPAPGAPCSSCLKGYGISRWIFQNSKKYYIDPAPGVGTERIFLWETNPDGGYYLNAYFGDLCVIGKFWERTSIKGKVVCKSTLKPIEFSEVILSSPSKGVYKTHTNKNGEYSFKSVIVDHSFSLASKGTSVQVKSLSANQNLTAPTIEAECSTSQTIYATWTYKGKTFKATVRQVDDDPNDFSCPVGKLDLGFTQTGSDLNILNFYNFDTSLSPGQTMEIDFCDGSVCGCCCSIDVGGPDMVYEGTVGGSIIMGPNKTFTFTLQKTDCTAPNSEVITVTGSGTFP